MQQELPKHHTFDQVVPFQEKYQNIMVSVSDAMEHSNVSIFLQFVSSILILKNTYTLIARLEVLVTSMNGKKKKKKKRLPSYDDNQNFPFCQI